MSDLLNYLLSPGPLTGMIVLVILLSVFILVRAKVITPGPTTIRLPDSISNDMPTVPSPMRRSMPKDVTDDRATDSDITLRGIITTPFGIAAPSVPTAEEAQETESRNLSEAAAMWLRRGDLPRALKCYRRLNSSVEVARLCRALDLNRDAITQFRQALHANPLDEDLRIELVELLLDTGEKREALDLVNAVMDSGSGPGSLGSPRFFERIGIRFEAADMEPEALTCYQRALMMNDAITTVLLRVRYLNEVNRLREAASTPPTPRAADKLLQAALARDSDVVVSTVDPPAEMTPEDAAYLAGTATIVGHLALGAGRMEPPSSVRSIFNRATRFSLERLLRANDDSVSFVASDRILDVPVMLRLFLLQGEGRRRVRELERRLQLISRVNHPNLAKVTFADRRGPILRLSVEFMPGGTLKEFIEKLPGVGAPLLVRLLIQTALGLEAAHRAGVLHGNVTGDNVLIGVDQRLKLTNFLLVPIASPADEETDSSAILGSSPPGGGPKAIGFQADLNLFADLIESTLALAMPKLHTVPGEPPGRESSTTAELVELVRRLRAAEFDSIARARLILEQILENTLRSSAAIRRGGVD